MLSLSEISFQFISFTLWYQLDPKMNDKFILFFFLVSFILRRFKNVPFKVMNFKFVIHNSRIYFGKRPVKLVPSKNKQFPASKGYFTFTIKGWTYYILFAPTGIKVTARRGRKIVRTFVTRKIKKILRPVKLPKSK